MLIVNDFNTDNNSKGQKKKKYDKLTNLIYFFHSELQNTEFIKMNN